MNTATLVYDNAGGDVLSDAATVNFPGISLVKSSTDEHRDLRGSGHPVQLSRHQHGNVSADRDVAGGQQHRLGSVVSVYDPGGGFLE